MTSRDLRTRRRPVDMMSDGEVRSRIASVPHWYHPVEFRPGLVAPGANPAADILAMLDLPAACGGVRVLDLGTRDGFFAFELERRGAEVTAVDYMAASQTGFAVAAELFGSRVRYLHANIYDLRAADLGRFDIVLFLGLLYHLPDPIEALRLIRSLCAGTLCVESHVIDDGLLLPDGTSPTLDSLDPILAQVPLMQFYPGRTLGGDPTNYWGPNMACLRAMLEETLFSVQSSARIGNRGVFNCRVVQNDELQFLGNLARPQAN